MTLDEAIKHCEEVMMENLEKTKDRNASDPIAISCGECASDHHQLAEWLKELKAYREHNGDAISRQAVIDILSDKPAFTDSISSRDSIFDVKHLLPVTSKQKIGHWIAEIDDYGEVMRWHCDKCYEDSGFTSTCKWNFCPNCGAKMEV